MITAALLAWAFVALPESVGYLVERRPPWALAAYNRIAAKLGRPPEADLPPATSRVMRTSLRQSMWEGVMMRRTILLWLSYGLLIASFYFANSFTAKLVAQSTGNDDIGITAQALVAAGGVIGALAFAALAARIHPRLVTAAVMGFGTIAFFAFANYFTVPSLVLVLAVFVGMAANGGVAAYYAISPPIYPTGIRTAAVGLMMGLGRIVAFLAPNVAVFLLAHGLTAPGVYRVCGVALALSGFAVWLLHKTYSGDNARDAMQLEASMADETRGSAALFTD
jgi:MFS family permease